MTRTLAAFLTIFLATFLTGCINSTTTVTVKKDGSGTIEERSLVAASFVQMMNQITQGLGQALGTEGAPRAASNPVLQDDDTYRRKAAALGEGVTFTSAEELKQPDGSVGARVHYHFDDVSALTIRPQDTMSAMDSLKSAIPMKIPGQPDLADTGGKGDPITFDFDPGAVASLKVHLPVPDKEEIEKAAGKASEAKAPSPNQLAQAKQFLGDMAFALLVVVDGEVVESSATHTEENATTLFSLEFGKVLDDPEAFVKLQELGKDKDFEKMKESFEGIEGMKFETSEEIEIRFK